MDIKLIDKLIAEKVMGWKISDKYPFDGHGWCIAFDEKIKRFLPTEYIEDAWLVAHKFQYHKIEMDAGHYYCTLANNGPFFDGDGETAPMAICLAALKAVGVEV